MSFYEFLKGSGVLLGAGGLVAIMVAHIQYCLFCECTNLLAIFIRVWFYFVVYLASL